MLTTQMHTIGGNASTAPLPAPERPDLHGLAASACGGSPFATGEDRLVRRGFGIGAVNGITVTGREARAAVCMHADPSRAFWAYDKFQNGMATSSAGRLRRS